MRKLNNTTNDGLHDKAFVLKDRITKTSLQLESAALAKGVDSIDFIDKLYHTYCEKNKDMFASDVDYELICNLKQISEALSYDLTDKLGDILYFDSLSAFRRGFAIAMKLATQGVTE